MPIKEHACATADCADYGKVSERFFHTSTPDPVCDYCGKPMAQMISHFQVVFTGPITARYNDRKLENAHREGTWIEEKNAPGGPKWTYVDDWQTRKRILKQEGLVEGGVAEVSSDGKHISSAGLPGAWI